MGVSTLMGVVSCGRCQMATRGLFWHTGKLLRSLDLLVSKSLSYRPAEFLRPQAIRVLGVYRVERRPIHASSARSGLEEFFQKGENLIEDAEKTGRPWLARELRHKSSEDLHKLWYILLKERNMLLTQRHEANRQGFIMPAPERLKKVRQSMARIKLVIGERNRAVREAREFLKSQESQEGSDENNNEELGNLTEKKSESVG